MVAHSVVIGNRAYKHKLAACLCVCVGSHCLTTFDATTLVVSLQGEDCSVGFKGIIMMVVVLLFVCLIIRLVLMQGARPVHRGN